MHLILQLTPHTNWHQLPSRHSAEMPECLVMLLSVLPTGSRRILECRMTQPDNCCLNLRGAHADRAASCPVQRTGAT